MPIYEYVCRECGHEMDALQKIADAPLVDCPQCNSPSLKRRISAPNFRLKGQGLYETDFKSDKEKKRNLADGGKSDDKSSKSDGDKKPSDKKSSSDGGKAA